jgi:hypothetical protein
MYGLTAKSSVPPSKVHLTIQIVVHIDTYLVDVLWCQPIKLIQVVSTSEFHKY